MLNIKFDIETNIKRFAKTIEYLEKAQQIFIVTVEKGKSSINNTKQSFIKEENILINEKNNKLEEEKLSYNLFVNEDIQIFDEITLLSQKLMSVDKKYRKIFKRSEYSNKTNYQIEILKKEIFGNNNQLTYSLSKIVTLFKNESFRYIDRPISSFFMMSKRRKNIYYRLIYMLLMSKDIVKLNKSEYEKVKIENIEVLINNYNKKTDELKSKYTSLLDKLEQNIIEDTDFIIETAINELNNIYNTNYYELLNKLINEYNENKFCINFNSIFSNSILIGSVFFKSNIFNSDYIVSDEFMKMNKKLFHNNDLINPCIIDISKRNNFFIELNISINNFTLKDLINSFILSFLTQLPINGLELSIIDPEQKGGNINPFLDLLNLMPEIFAKKICTSTETITNRLQDLNQYVDNIIQQKLSNKYETILEYNYATPATPLPCKLVCIFDFPKFFDSRSYEYLLSIMKNGYRCGIVIIICFNKSELRTTYNDTLEYINEIKKTSIVFEQMENSIKIVNENIFITALELPKQGVIDVFCHDYEKASKSNLNKGISFSEVAFTNGLFSQKSSDGLMIPVGKGDGSVIQNIEIGGKSSHHVLITGATGSGKSTLLHTLIMSSLINYSPDELLLYLMDFKSGTEFKIYETYKVPHIKLLALDALQEFGASILSELLEEQIRRSNIFKDNGDHKSIKSYVQITGDKMPRILVIMDEFQILFNEQTNRKIALQCAEMVNKIVTEGRAFGIHLIMATQTIRNIREKTTMSISTLEQMRVRIGLKCSEEDANLIFGDNNSRDALSKMRGAIGTAVYNNDYTESKNYGFRVAHCTDEEQTQLLQKIALEWGRDKSINIKIFEGRRVIDYPYNSYILDSIDNNDVEVEIGEPIRVAPPVILVFGKRKNTNLLIVGNNNIMSTKIMRLLIIGILMNTQTQIYYLDGNNFLEEPSDVFISSFVNLAQDRFLKISDRKNCLLLIEEIYEELKLRKKNMSTNKTRLFLIIDGLQSIDLLCSVLKGDRIIRNDYIEGSLVQTNEDVDPFSIDSTKYMENYDYSSMIKDIIETGYIYGINTILICNDYLVVKDVLHYGSSILNKLPIRIVFSISDKDCDDLIEGAKVSNINDITVLCTDSLKNTFQFKPYEIKNQEHINKLFIKEKSTEKEEE